MSRGRESRAQEAVKMKDEQLRILTEQNSQLLRSLDAVIDHNSRKNAFLTGRVGKEEEAKRKTLLRYVDAVKELAAEKAAGGGAILQLPSSSVERYHLFIMITTTVV